jgi:Fe-S cluster assembly protein SufD
MNNATSTVTERLQALWLAQQPAAGGWLPDLQRKAIDQFGRTGFPTTRNENWKYTDVSKLAQLYPDWLIHKTASTDAMARKPLAIVDAIHLVFVDGAFQPAHSSSDLPDSLVVGNLTQLAHSHREILESRLNQLSQATDSGFVALNTAFSADCAALILAAGTTLTRPVYIEHWSGSHGTSSHPRLLVDLGDKSQATVIEHYSSSVATLVNAVAELSIGRGANLTYYRLQEAHPEAWHTGLQRLRLDSDATVRSMTIDCGSIMSRSELYAYMAGPGATIEAQGLLLGDGSRHIDSRITIEHAAPHTTSRVRYRAILGDKSRGVFNGRILVQQQAQKTNAELTNRNLLLNRGAEINTKPELEIYADDVKCAHGSTTGQLDETAFFYLLSRGIDKQAARNMLITAFASELLTDIEVPAIAERTRHALSALRFSDL